MKLFKIFLTIALTACHHMVLTQPSDDPLKMDIQIINNNLFVKVLLNGKGPYNFIFDSGASGIGRIDKRIAAELELPVVDSVKNYDGSGAFKIEPQVGIQTIEIGHLIVRNANLLTRDYNKHKSNEPLIDGIIGRDFFYEYLLVIDCPNQVMIASDDSLRRNSKGAIAYTRPFVIEGKVGKMNAYFHIDTGSNLSMHFPGVTIESVEHKKTTRQGIARKAIPNTC